MRQAVLVGDGFEALEQGVVVGREELAGFDEQGGSVPAADFEVVV